MSKPYLLSAYTEKTKCIRAVNADYAEVGEWADGNPTNEDRIGYFVSVDNSTPGITMVKATSTSDVRGVTVESPGFSANSSNAIYDTSGNLLGAYNYVAFAGFVPVIDNGTCTINKKCMPTDDGTAVPSTNEFGYQVIDRIDATHILVLVEPQGDAIQRFYDKFTTNMLQGTIPKNKTTLTINDASIKSDSVVDVYFWDKLISPKTVSVSTGSIKIIIEAQGSDTLVGVRVL